MLQLLRPSSSFRLTRVSGQMEKATLLGEMREGSAYMWVAAHVASSCYKWAQDERYAPSFFSFYQHTNVPAGLEEVGSCQLLRIFPPST